MKVKLIVEEYYNMMEARINETIAKIEKTGYVLDVRLQVDPMGATAMILYEEGVLEEGANV